MRTGRARLIEWIQDIQNNAVGAEKGKDEYVFDDEWADRIMEDINLGIITAEVDG